VWKTGFGRHAKIFVNQLFADINNKASTRFGGTSGHLQGACDQHTTIMDIQRTNTTTALSEDGLM
jgi:hypothetical protein